MDMNNFIFVDVEGHGPAPGLNDTELFEFGAVMYPSRETFHGHKAEKNTFEQFDIWIKKVCSPGLRPLFISDNPAYDWQFINYYFHLYLGYNPFGWSARRISDFYAGLMGDFQNTQKWKQLRITEHDHNPVHDALGNVEAFDRLLKGER